MSFALVFSGQGTQHPAMLPWLKEDALVHSMCARLGIQDWRAAVADGPWAVRNANAQTLLTGLALSAWQQISPDLPTPSAMAGYSVGELAAFSAAGVFDAQTALDLSCRRALLMDRCAEDAPGGMIAVAGISSEMTDQLCRSTGLAVAIRTGPGTVVLGGTRADLDLAESTAASQGLRCTRLRVGIASHTPWMKTASQAFRETLSPLAFHPPRCALFSNAADRIHGGESAKQALADQISSTVKWDECMESIRARAVRCVLEIGPGAALARMWNETYPDIPARSCDEFRSAAGVTKWVCAVIDR